MKSSIKYLTIILVGFSVTSCQYFGKQKQDSLTGWTKEDKENIGYYESKNLKKQETPPGMVLIEGGTFTMGAVQDDVMFDWNTTPVKQQVRSFYMDEAEVTNNEYLFFITWVQKVFPPNNPDYKHIYQSVVPDTLVWRNVLGSNELLTENYLRHPSYSDYPVVGVSWIQANQYCKWRTDRVNEKRLMDAGVLKNVYADKNIEVKGKNHFNTDTYLSDPQQVFGENNAYNKGLQEKGSSKKGFFGRITGIFKSDKNSKRDSLSSFTGRHVQLTDGILTPKFRLPTELEWEYAARAVNENREYNNTRGRKKYTWNSNYTRNKGKKYRGDQLANFKQGKGNYSGISGWSSDGAAITNKVKSYPPNAFGLYDMAGNVAEWVADVYRPIIDNNANDFNYFRGNIFTKKMIGEDGKVVIVDDKTVSYDTLDNGKIIPSQLPGSVKYIPITGRDAYMRNNYDKAYNVDVYDGEWSSTRFYNKDVERDENLEKSGQYRMYNSPMKPREINEEGVTKTVYDTKVRRSLISDKTRVYKGGSWKDLEYWLDPSQRRYLPEYSATNFIGFRCATDRIGAMAEGKKRAYPKNRK